MWKSRGDAKVGPVEGEVNEDPDRMPPGVDSQCEIG
jgi:hypothetical protein